MKTILFCALIIVAFSNCSNTSNETNTIVDTTIIGSDNPHPAPDTARIKQDSPGK
jgi:hypothetical protein